jgi:drug/metabolite transporter (DMT)-like permease
MIGWLWIPFTFAGAAGQVARNAMQRGLTGPLGTVGATHIRFLFGFPFSLVFLAVVLAATGDRIPSAGATFGPWLALGALMQIAATALMLAAMTESSFVVTVAYIKTEPVQAALFGFVFLGDHLTAINVTGIVVATIGVVVTAVRPGGAKGFGALRPTLFGLAAAAGFALSSVGYRGAILELHGVSFVTAATSTLVCGLLLQTVILTAYLALRDRAVLAAIARLWKPSMFAGFLGAFASQFWFLAFALATAASVRTLALVEVLFAQLVARYGFGQRTSAREAIGMALVVCGVALLLLAY